MRVESLAALDIDVDAPEALTGADIDVDLQVTDLRPQVGSALSARDVHVSQVISPYFETVGVSGRSSSQCATPGRRLACSAGTLSGGSSVDVTVKLRRKVAPIYDLDTQVTFEATTTTTDATEQVYSTTLPLSIAADATDTDGDGMTDLFERTYGLTSGIGSGAAADKDGDGRNDRTDNCPTRSNATQANLDRDSQGDVCDLDDDNDGMTDSYEDANGLNPRSAADARLDNDGDGLDNLTESRFGTDPNRADTGGDGLGDAQERNAVVLPSILQLLLD